MSFGFSVGDFLAVIGLITQLRKDFADAPSQLRDLSAELKTFSILLQDAEVDLAADEVDPRQHEAFESTLSSARDFLKDLEKFIDDNKEIPKSAGSKAKVNIKRIWKRANFDQKEVSKFRHQISLIISGLQMLTSNEVKHHARKIARYVDKQEHRHILKWLSDDDFSYHKDYQSHLVRNRESGTRKWLLGSNEWKSWLKCGGQTLYCPGIPGSGKTFTTAMVIENIGNLSEDYGWVFAYVFCNYQQRKENMCEVLLRSLLRMVLEQTQEIPDNIQRWPTRNKEIKVDELMEQLRIAISSCSRVFFMIDALDELDVFGEFVSYLFDLQRTVGVNLYFTSRNIPHIRVLFDEAMLVPIKATEHDVGVYLEHQMRKPNVPAFVRGNQALQDEIKETVINSVGEMFLLAELQVIQLMQSKSTRRLQNALKAITSGTSTYETAYQNVMDRINSQDQRLCELATNAISILTYAERPLRAQELVHALSVDLDLDESSNTEIYKKGDLQSMIESLGVYDPDLMPTIEEVLAASAGLIVHQPDSGVVQLVHKTTKEYLMSDDGKKKWFPRAQLTIAAICLIYSQAFEDSDGKTEWPFLDYAQKHYGHHIMAHRSLERSQGPASAPFSNKASDSKSSTLVLQTQQLIDQIGLTRMAEELGGTEDVLIVACGKNQVNFARVLLSTKQYNRPSRRPENVGSLYAWADCAIDRALLAAVRNGHLEPVELLLKYGANPIIQSKDIGVDHGMNLLALAAREGYHNIVSHLLDHGCFTMAMMQHDRDGFGDEPAEMRVPRKPRDLHVHSPICHAAISGNIQCVKTLLKWVGIETNINVRDKERDRIIENVTLCAIAGLHAHVLEILPRLSDINIYSMLRGLGHPNLLFASIRWSKVLPDQDRQAVAEFFLRTYTFDFSERDADSNNVFILAAKKDMGKIAYLILKEREDLLNSQDDTGRTALSWAIEWGDMDSISVLLGYQGIQAELLDDKGLTPIDHLCQINTIQRGDVIFPTALLSMIPLLEHGINTSVQQGCTLLHVLIDTRYYYDRKLDSWEMRLWHWRDEICRGPKVSEHQKLLTHIGGFESPFAQLYASGFRKLLGATSASAAEVRASPCKCGIGTIFLAVSTERVEIVEVLLDFYPDLVNDRFVDGSSPLDLASCIRDQQRRQSMIDLILSKNPIIETYKTNILGSRIDPGVPGEAQNLRDFTGLELRQIQGDCAGTKPTAYSLF